jgi:hypothetical protein
MLARARAQGRASESAGLGAPSYFKTFKPNH